MRPTRIIHLPWNVGGNPIGLSRAERELGFVSDVMVKASHSFGYEADYDLDLNTLTPGPHRRRRVAFLMRAVRRYDVFHYNFGSTVLERRSGDQLRTEIPWLRRLGKVVLSTWQGDDARPPSHNPWGLKDPDYLEEVRVFQAKRRQHAVEWAHRVFCVTPDIRRWLPGSEFRPYASVDPRAIVPSAPPDRDEVVVVHAPSDRAIKGTDHVVAAVESLRAEGVPIRLDLVEGVPHTEAVARYAAADLAVDQLNFGWYGGFAVEVMAMRRPVLCAILDGEVWDNPLMAECPIVRTSIETLKEDLRSLVADRARRHELGAASRRYVEKHHDPRRIALQNLEGLVPIPGDAHSLPSSVMTATEPS